MLGQGPFGRPNLAALAGADALSIVAVLYGNQSVFYGVTVAEIMPKAVLPVLFDSAALTAFYAPALTMGGQVIPETWVNQSLFYAPTLEHEILVSVFTNQSLFYVPLVDTFLKFLNLERLVNDSIVYQPVVGRIDPPYVYEYPIGNQLDSDYGIRESMTFYKQRLVLGHRYGRRR